MQNPIASFEVAVPAARPARAARVRSARIAAVLAACLFATGAPAGAKDVAAPGTLVVVSTTDVKGKTGPCGCHTPKGGLARLANFADSARIRYPNLLLVENGGFFPELDDYQDVAAFMLESHVELHHDAIGVSERELRFGRAFLLVNGKRTGAPLVCANLVDRATHKPLVAPWVVRKVAGTTVGVFGLTSDKVDLGPAHDSVSVDEPAVAARTAIAQLRAKGASVIVLLSSLGKVETEDLVTAVDGVDLAIAGRSVPLMQQGRTIKSTLVCYGGEQGQYAGRSLLTLDAAGRVTQATNETVMLGPEVGDQPKMLARVKAFEDRSADRRRKLDKERAAQAGVGALPGADSTGTVAADHFLGSEFCQRCHKAEYEQWKTTAHARAWPTLLDAHAQSKAECVSCHVTGYRQAGGFRAEADAPRLGGVQCESCHGMGTSHDAYAAIKSRVAESTCRTCHTAKVSPDFALARYRPYIDHAKLAADLPALDVRRPMRTSGAGGGH